MTFRQFWVWTCSSLWGHLVFWALIFTFPMCCLGLWLNYTEGTLTLQWAPYIVLYAVLGGFVLGVIIWFTITSPLMSHRRKQSPPNNRESK
jgi:hypothetical protein